MDEKGHNSLDAWVPRSLVRSGKEVLSASVTAEGLCSVRIGWEGGVITSLEPIHCESKSSLKLLLPRLVEPHTHIDKAFTWFETPNLAGDYQGALAANLQGHKNRMPQDVLVRAERALGLALNNGHRAIRSHVDSFGPVADQSWEVLLGLRSEWQSLIELQLVALVPLEYWTTSQGYLLASRVAAAGCLLGGVLVPPFDKEASRSLLCHLIKTANDLNCGIDLHIDESQIEPAAGIKLLIEVLDQIGTNVSITCSHLSSMSLLPRRALQRMADHLAQHEINVVALPLTNAWLLGRKTGKTPDQRLLAPVAQLQQAGVKVAVGGDNVQDPWFPIGNLDPLALMSFSMPFAQLAPWKRLGLSPFTTSAANLMGLEWDGTIGIGSPAELLLLDASSWSEALSSPPQRRVLIHGCWADEMTIPRTKSKL